MARVFVKDNLIRIELSEEESKKSNLNANKEYEFLKAKEGLFLLSEKAQAAEQVKDYSAIDKKIFSLLSDKKQLSNAVEGRFEKLLNKEELSRFNELLKLGNIIKFKLSDKYKRAIYKISEKFVEKKSEHKTFSEQNIGHKPSVQQIKPNSLQTAGEYFPTLTKDGYTIVEESVAKEISEDCADRIKDKELYGMKMFDGKYCVIESWLFEKHEPKILEFIKKNKCSDLASISSNLNLPESLARVICGLLCEKGDLMEKRRNLYCFIS
ncbi:MAG: hypothetical protein AABW72_06215 [archaeon]